MEIPWCMEFYDCLPPGFYLSPSVGRLFTKNGIVDFYVADKQWAIEFLINGSSMKKHSNRFEKGIFFLIDVWLFIKCN